MASIIVLGAGMIGRAMALDLARAHDVTSVDVSAEALARLPETRRLATRRLDITDHHALKKAVSDFDLVIGAVPGFLGLETLRTVISAGRHVVDISFCSENALELDGLARETGACAIVDMGVAPGMDNFILGYHAAALQVERFECLVGGLPKVRRWPFEYKAPFSPIDVIEEYVRPARLMENGHLVTRPALSEPELVEFDGVGTLEAFNTDGLRSLLFTMRQIPNMKEKTLRYPGHVQLITALRDAGFLAPTKMKFDSADIAPREFTSRILTQAWRLEPGEPEMTLMRVTVSGSEDGRARKYVYHLHDEYDAASNTTSMARTTGYACTAAAHLVLNGTFAQPGVHPPERVGAHAECFAFVLKYLAERNIVYRAEEEVEERAGPARAAEQRRP